MQLPVMRGEFRHFEPEVVKYRAKDTGQEKSFNRNIARIECGESVYMVALPDGWTLPQGMVKGTECSFQIGALEIDAQVVRVRATDIQFYSAKAAPSKA